MVCGLFAGVCASFGPQAAGRFLEVDADEIDAEAVYGSETFNDKLSYRLPSAWVRLWDAHDTGVRVSAGSLDIRRFDYLEDVKLVAAPDGPLSIGFEQTRREDSLEARTERAFRIEGRLSGPLRLFMLGDGGVNKEYGDVGWGVAWRRDRDHDVRAYVWSVDHFYDSKKVEPDDRRTRKPDTAGAKVRWVLGEVRLAAELEADHPLRWHRPSLGYDYEYERRVASYRVEVPQGDALSLFAEGRHEVKLESRMWQGGGSEQGRAMERRADSLELGMERSEALEDWTAGVAFFKRRATYRVVAPAGLPEGELIEAAGPNDVRRVEAAPYATWHFPVGEAGHFLQIGAHASEVRLREVRDERFTEVKAQFAWDYALTATARLSLNTTWDLDQLVTDYPYQERPFRPWGGGNIQMIAMF